ncbi:MAG: hypothetical protein RJB13_1197 [Pseudomonadota bacterium]|jgi:hypothetical protein
MRFEIKIITIAICMTFTDQSRAEEQCKDVVLNFVDSGSMGSDLKQRGRRVTALIPCNSLPWDTNTATPTTLHFIDHSDSQLCISQRSCGNIQYWSGHFALSAGWSDVTTLSDFWIFARNGRIATDWNGYQLVASFAVGRGQIERDCGPMTKPSCISSVKGSKNDVSSWK